MDGVIHPLADIAEGLERHGYERASAVAYTLAYVKTRGGGGWLNMGDAKHEYVLLRGIGLRPNEALDALATEIAYLLRNISYNAGVSCHLIERAAAWGAPEIARDCWWVAYDVIKHRLPTDDTRIGWFESLDPTEFSDCSIDEGLVSLLFARLSHPVLDRKVAALAGIASAVALRPDAVFRPLQTFLSQDTPTSSVCLVLDVLWRAEKPPYLITERTADLLGYYSRCELWGFRILARRLLERCNLFSPIRIPDNVATQEITISVHEKRILLSADVGKRLKRLEKIWPDIPEQTALRLHELFQSSDVHKERCRARYRMALGEDGDTKPPTPVLLWEHELLETALHQTLNGIDSHLWTKGKWYKTVDEDILKVVLPNTTAHLGINATRIPRPNYPDPAMETDGWRDLLALNDDPCYPGWWRIAFVERHWVRENNVKYRSPTVLATLFAGAVALPLGRTSQPNDFPFHQADIINWWDADASPVELPVYLPLGPLTGLIRLTDWLGDVFVLVPPIKLRAYLGLQPPKFGEPLIWKSDDGEPTIVLRTWRVRDSEQLWSEPLEYEGSDLLMRPDVYKRMEELAGGAIQELVVMWREPVNSDN